MRSTLDISNASKYLVEFSLVWLVLAWLGCYGSVGFSLVWVWSRTVWFGLYRFSLFKFHLVLLEFGFIFSWFGRIGFVRISQFSSHFHKHKKGKKRIEISNSCAPKKRKYLPCLHWKAQQAGRARAPPPSSRGSRGGAGWTRAPAAAPPAPRKAPAPDSYHSWSTCRHQRYISVNENYWFIFTGSFQKRECLGRSLWGGSERVGGRYLTWPARAERCGSAVLCTWCRQRCGDRSPNSTPHYPQPTIAEVAWDPSLLEGDLSRWLLSFSWHSSPLFSAE